ncbi:MAG: sigma-E processing peptidase SpoIIGA [Bacilli bacterium]|nr:sigma-E processing peptidase SpoIIGA [Bacilli bacterium]
MKVYLDVILVINLIFDFIVLLSSSIILKRKVKLIRIVLGSLIGSLSMLILFIRFNTISLFIFKIVVSSLMIISVYGFKNIRYFVKNTYYFYLISVITGGIIYFVNNQFMTNNKLLFSSTYSYNIILGIILSIIGLIIYIRNIKSLKTNYNKYLNVVIYFKNYELKVNAFLDTGNKLKDPYLFRPIILLNKNMVKYKENVLLVPYNTCNSSGLLECIKAEKIYIEGVGYKKNFLVGLSNSIYLDGINCILNERLLEG